MGIGEDGGAGSGSITNVDVGSGAVHFAHAQAQAVVGERVRAAARQGQAGQAVFVIVSEAVSAAVDIEGGLVAVEVVAMSLIEAGGDLVMGVIGELLKR